MIFGRTDAQRREKQGDCGWRPWFAWRPVRIEDGRIAWLQTVMRQRIERVEPDRPLAFDTYYRGLDVVRTFAELEQAKRHLDIYATCYAKLDMALTAEKRAHQQLRLDVEAVYGACPRSIACNSQC